MTDVEYYWGLLEDTDEFNTLVCWTNDLHLCQEIVLLSSFLWPSHLFWRLWRICLHRLISLLWQRYVVTDVSLDDCPLLLKINIYLFFEPKNGFYWVKKILPFSKCPAPPPPRAGFHWVAYDVKVAYIVRLFYLWLRNYLSEAFVLLFLFLFDCIFRKMVHIPMIWIKSCLLMFL